MTDYIAWAGYLSVENFLWVISDEDALSLRAATRLRDVPNVIFLLFLSILNEHLRLGWKNEGLGDKIELPHTMDLLHFWDVSIE